MPFMPALIDAQWSDPSTIAASSTWNSNVVVNDGLNNRISVGLTSSQPGQLTINRYLDNAGTVLLDSHSAALSAGTSASLSIVDTVPFVAFQVSISNTSGSPATVTKFGGLARA